MTRVELNTYIDTNITDKTAVDSLTPINEGEALKAVADYVDQEILTVLPVVKNVKVSLSSAEILNLFTSPKQLLPAVAGKLYIPKSMFQIYTHATSAYSGTGGGNWRIAYGSSSLWTTSFPAQIQSADNGQAINPLSTSSVSVSGTAFSGLSLILTPPTSDPVGGDGTLDLYITYYEITII